LTRPSDVADGRSHRRVSSTYVAFVLAHRLDEKILPLTGDPRDVIAAGQVRVVANVAAMLAYQGLPTDHARRIGCVGRRPRRRQPGDRVGKYAQVVVGEAFYGIVHDVEATQLFAKQVELDEDVG